MGSILHEHFSILKNFAGDLLRCWLAVSLFIIPLAGCSTPMHVHYPGEDDPSSRNLDKTSCLGILSEDASNIIGKKLSGAILKFLSSNTPTFAGGKKPPRIALSTQGFINNTKQTIQPEILFSAITSGLYQNSKGKIALINRAKLEAVISERRLKRQGQVDRGALGLAAKIAGADYMLFWDGMTENHRDIPFEVNSSGIVRMLTSIVLVITAPLFFIFIPEIFRQGQLENTTSVSFSLVDLETGASLPFVVTIVKRGSVGQEALKC